MPNRSFLLLACSALAALSACADDGEPIPQPVANEDMVAGTGRPPARASALSLEEAGEDTEAENEEDSGPEGAIAFSAPPSRYDRARAVWYARHHALSPNPLFAYCRNRWTGEGADCTNFVSQALWFGGLVMHGGPQEAGGWWYRTGCAPGESSDSWRQVNSLIYYLVIESKRGRFIPVSQVRPGDLIFYKLWDKNGACPSGLSFNHSTIVTGFGPSGTPLVSYHTREVRDIPWNWSLRESGGLGLGDACQVAVVQIQD